MKHLPNVLSALRMTGFLLFIAVPTLFWTLIPVSVVTALATFAAIQEGHLIRTRQAG